MHAHRGIAHRESTHALRPARSCTGHGTSRSRGTHLSSVHKQSVPAARQVVRALTAHARGWVCARPGGARRGTRGRVGASGAERGWQRVAQRSAALRPCGGGRAVPVVLGCEARSASRAQQGRLVCGGRDPPGGKPCRTTRRCRCCRYAAAQGGGCRAGGAHLGRRFLPAAPAFGAHCCHARASAGARSLPMTTF